MTRTLSIPVALCLCLTVPGVAMAQGQVPPPPAGSAAAPAATPAQANLTPDQKKQRARMLYGEAEALTDGGSWAAAVPKYEEAYYLMPGKHGFARKVGLAAWNAKDCAKADEYLKHFVKYADSAKKQGQIDDAKRIIGEISVSGCASTPAPAPVAVTPIAGGTPAPAATDEVENPLNDIKSQEDLRGDERDAARAGAEGEKRPLFVGGVLLTLVGIGGLGLGAVTNIIAAKTANQLADLSSNSTATGFPNGDYSSSESDGPFNLETRLGTMNVITPIGYIAGGLLLAGGIAMIIVHKKKNGPTTTARNSRGPQLTGLGPSLLPAGAGGSASFRF